MNDGFDIRDVLRQALDRGNETATVEFKESANPDDNEQLRKLLLRPIAAMSNGETEGFLFVGVKDDPPEIVGLPTDLIAKFDHANLYRKVAAFLAPPPKFDVHRFVDNGREVVGIVVHPFDQVPTFVAQGFRGHSAGTMLIRTPGGESAPAAKESDIRALCDRIVARHAETVAGYINRYSRLSAIPLVEPGHEETPEHEALRHVRALASNYWHPDQPYIEVFFAPCSRLALDREAFRQLFPWSRVTTQHHGFPTSSVHGWHGPRMGPSGWIATIPDRPTPDSAEVPQYLWAMHVSWGFVDRDRFWEDDGAPRIVGGIGIMHLAVRICLLLRWLRRIGKRYGLDPGERFLVGARLKGVQGRYLASEYATDTDRIARVEEDDVTVAETVSLGELGELPQEGVAVPRVVFALMEEAGWLLGRTDLRVDTYSRAIQQAAVRVEPAVLFPRDEDVPIFTP